MNLNTILNQFRKFLPPEWLNSFARQSGLIKRSSARLIGQDYCQLLIQAVNSSSELSLSEFCKHLYEINSSVKLKPQSLWEYIVKRESVVFMEGIYAKTWAIYVEQIKRNCSTDSQGFLNQFNQVFIEDSTIIQLNEKLSSMFKGCGGSASRAAIKIHLAFDVLSSKFSFLKIHQGKVTDVSLAFEAVRNLTEGSLLMRDLGFFVIDAFRKISEKNAYFISRLHPGVNVYLKADDSNPIDLVRYLNCNYKLFASGSMIVFMGIQEKLPVRLIFYRAPEEIVNTRRRKVKRNREKHGHTASEHLLAWQEFTFLITNLSEEIAPTKIIGTIYRLRWQVELIFKNWKSHLSLDVLRGSRPERIEVFLYAKLIGILMLGLVCNYLKSMTLKLFGTVEISEMKVAKFIVSTEFFNGLFKGYLKKALIHFTNDEYWIKQFCKQKRKRKTTIERIDSQEQFGTHQALA